MALGDFIPIRYTLVEQSELLSRGTVFHLLSESECELLRCFMTLLQLPTSTKHLLDGPPFFAAVSRALSLPNFRKAETKREPPPPLWDDMNKSPLVILMVGNAAPIWLEPLTAHRHIGVLTSSEALSQSLRQLPRVHVGLLKGFEDLRESYRVISEMILVATDDRFGVEVGSISRELAKRDIFDARMRLDFIPGFPLPPSDRGRAAAYRLNRLSNNVNKPAVAPDFPIKGLTTVPSMFEWCLQGCTALGLLEMNQPIPEHFGISENELKDHRKVLLDGGKEADERFHRLLDLGSRIADGKAIQRPFFVIPVPRYDLIRGKGPKSVNVDPRTKREIRAAVRAVKDFTRNGQETASDSEEDKEAYKQAWWTLESEQRLMSCQAAWLSAGSQTVPIQLNPRPGPLYSKIRALYSALEHNSRKISALFRSVEMILAQMLPDGLLKHLDDGSSPITFFSELPFEWTMLDEWPVCLTRPVSRIPIGFSHWDVLSAAMDWPAEIDTKDPGRVLIFDLIQTDDPVKRYSDAFASTSEGLAQRYTYASPKDANEFVGVLANAKADVVVLDTHGGYDRSQDKLLIEIAGLPVPLDDLLPDFQVPPVWILSACDTSVSGAMRGCFVRALLGRGALCVIAGLSRVDAFVASMFVGRLLTDIFSPPKPNLHRNFHEVFFVTQYTTALLYDPLLPFFKLAEKQPDVRQKLALVLSDFFGWTLGRELDIRKYRYEIAYFVGESLLRHGLQQTQIGHIHSGIVRPETLLFSAFGVPSCIKLRI
jgi:hypothetical protein